MPALGNRRVVSPQSIKARAKKPAPPARKLPAAPTHAAAGVKGTSAPPVRGAVHAAPTKGQEPRTRYSYLQGKTRPGRLGGAQLPGVKAAEIQKGREYRAQQRAKAPSNLSATILNVPAAIEAKGYQNIASIIPGKTGKAITEGIGKVGTEAAQLGTAPFLAGLKTGEAAAHATKGEYKPAKELAKGLTEGALGKLLQGDVKGAEKAAKEHPGFAATEVAGLAGLAGRTAGAVSRGVGMKYAGRVRPAIALDPEAGAARANFVKQRTYSGDVGRKAIQYAADLKREPLRDSKGRVVTIKDRGHTVPVLLPKSEREMRRLQQGRANYASARAIGAGREAKSEATQKALEASTAPGRIPLALRSHIKHTIKGQLRPVHLQRKITPVSARHIAEHLAQLVASGTLRTGELLKKDLQAHIDRIQEAVNNPTQFRDRKNLAVAQGNLALLKAAIEHPSVMKQAEGIAKQGINHGRQLTAYDAEMAKRNVYPAEQLERARLSEYAMAHMGAHHTDEGWVDSHGHPITNEQIKAHAQAWGRDPETLAYLPHRMVTNESKASFYKPFVPGKRAVGKEPTRKGTAYKRGTAPMTSTMLHEELTNKATTIASVDQYDKMVREAGRLHPAVEKSVVGEPLTKEEQKVVEAGGHFTDTEARQWANKLAEEGLGEFLPVRAFAAKLDAEAQKQVANAQSATALEDVRSQLLNDRIVKEGENTTARNVVLVPADYVNQLRKQVAPINFQPARLAQMLNSPFRMAVLSQPRWLTGNFVEPYFVRLPLSGSGINIPGLGLDMTAGIKVLKELKKTDPQAYKEIRGLYFSGRYLGGKQATVRRTTADVPMTQFMDKLPAVKQLGHLIALYPKMFFAINRLGIEDPTAVAALGKQARHDIQAATGHWTKTVTLTDAAVKDAAKGLVDTATQHRYAEYYWELLGQYDGFKPELKHAIQTVTPFLPWTLASLRFVYWTLPAHHTVAWSGLMRLSQKVIAEWEAEHKGAPPGELKYAPKSRGGYLPVFKYTPGGITIPASQGPVLAAEQLGNTVLPQVSSSWEALHGRDPFGRELKVPKTATNQGKASEGQATLTAANALAESVLPILSQVRRLREKGGTPYATSTALSPQVKPGTTHEGMGAFERTFNPFRPIYVKPKTKKAAKPKGLGPKGGSKLGPSGGGSKLGPSGGGGLGPS